MGGREKSGDRRQETGDRMMGNQKKNKGLMLNDSPKCRSWVKARKARKARKIMKPLCSTTLQSVGVGCPRRIETDFSVPVVGCCPE
jgi:hypothetical protein